MDLGWILYWRPPESIAEGFELEDYLPDDLAVWPCHVQALAFFHEFCRTQWRLTPAGTLAGLDYTAVLACLKSLRLSKKDADKLFSDVRQIERGAVEASNAPGEQSPTWRKAAE